MTYPSIESGSGRHLSRAAIFVDYENVYRVLDETPRGGGNTTDLIVEMIGALRELLRGQRETRTAVALAYADFTSMDGHGDRVQHGLYLEGVEPRFVPRALQANTVEIQLCVDALDLLHHRPDIDTFVLLTGRRTYLPLVRHLKRAGRRVLVVAFEEPPAMEHVLHLDGESFYDARDLLGGSSRRESEQPKDRTVTGNGADVLRRPSDFTAIDDPMLIRTIEIIDRFFGHYEEVYLTPLLRKLSEVIGDHTCDPKSLISNLEERLAVRLEKRQGFPHDYTVLIVEEEHPDVARIRKASAGRSDGYHNEEYAEDGDGSAYDDDYDDYEFEEEFEDEPEAGCEADFDADNSDDGDDHRSRI